MNVQTILKVSITSVRFDNYKALKSFSVSLQRMNVLVGPNNCGKSTVIRAFRVLEVVIKHARAKRAERIKFEGINRWGHYISEDSLPISLDNVHTDYEETHASITFRCSNGCSLRLVFPADGGCILFPDGNGKDCNTPGRFKERFPIAIQTVPELGPLEYEEVTLTEETIRRGLSTHRAARHFRNYWRLFPEGFDKFADTISQSWPGMEIEPPEVVDVMARRLAMFCRENRISREIYWAGFGFQIWCQLLTHISRSGGSTILIIDEPEVYLHPDVQRQLVGILRDAEPDVLIASHSTEIIGESDPSEILLVDKTKNSATRLKDVNQVQVALEAIGSLHNVALTHLARTGRLLFVESMADDKILRRFARVLGYDELSTGNQITTIESDGFGSWKRIEASAWAFEKALQGQFKIGVVFDRDYFCEEEIQDVTDKLKRHFDPIHIHEMKEFENYLLVPDVLERAIRKVVRDRERRTGETSSTDFDVNAALYEITDSLKDTVTSQLVAKRLDYHKSSGTDASSITNQVLGSVKEKWPELGKRLAIVPGKEVLKRLREKLKESHSVNLSDVRIIDEFKSSEIPPDLVQLLVSLNEFRTK